MMKSFLKNSFSFLVIVFLVVVSFFAFTANVFAEASSNYGVTNITPDKTYATADGTYENGWSWVFDVTVPENETELSMKFADWVGTLDTIKVADNIKFYSEQSLNAFDLDSAITINKAEVYSNAMHLDSEKDLEPSIGRQIKITIVAAVPEGSAGGSYSTSYGLRALDTTAPTLDVTGFIVNGSIEMGSDNDVYVLITDGNSNTENTIQFKAGSTASEDLNPSIVGLFLELTPEQASSLKDYYLAEKAIKYKTYFDDVADGIKPLAYIESNGRTIDGAIYNVDKEEVDMIIPGDYPAGIYKVSSTIEDLAGHKTTVTYTFKILPTSITVVRNSTGGTGSEFDTETNTFSGTIDYYLASSSSEGNPPTDGNYVGVTITAPDDVIVDGENATFKYTNQDGYITTLKGSAWLEGDNHVNYYPKVTAERKTFPVVIDWDGVGTNYAEEAIVITVASDAILTPSPILSGITVTARETSEDTNEDKITVVNVWKAWGGNDKDYIVEVKQNSELETVENSVNGEGGKWFGLQLAPTGITSITELQYKTAIQKMFVAGSEKENVLELGADGQLIWWINGDETKSQYIYLKYAGESDDTAIKLTLNFIAERVLDGIEVKARTVSTNGDKITIGDVIKNDKNYTVTVKQNGELETVASSQGEGKWFGLQLKIFEGMYFSLVSIPDLQYKTTAQGTFADLTIADVIESEGYGELVWWINGDISNTQEVYLKYKGESDDTTIKLTINFITASTVVSNGTGGTGSTFDTNTNTFGGTIDYYLASSSSEGNPPTDGNYVGVTITAPSDVDVDKINATFKYTNQDGAYTTLTGNQWLEGDNYVNYYPKVTAERKIFTVAIDWDGIGTKYAEETIVINVASDAILTVELGTVTVAKNSGFSDGNITPSINNQKIGSYVIQAGSSEDVRINNFTVALGGTLPIASLSNLYIKYNGTPFTPIHPQVSNNFAASINLAASESMTVDVYADIGAAIGETVQTTLGMSTTGVSTNTTIEVGDTMGQEVNIVNATLATPTLTTSSAAAQFVLGGSTASIAQYNFVATNGEVTLDKLVFSSTNSAIATITANGKTFYVINGNVTINNLGYVIPAGYAGKTLPISVTYNNVGKSGDAAVTSNTASTLTLTGFEYLAGNTRTIITGITVAANTLNVVNAIPSVSLTSASRAGLINGLVKLADVTISASSNGGAIKINDLPITVTSTGVATASGIVVKDASGTTIVTSDDTLGVSAGTSDDVVIFFTNGYSILPGESKTFSLYTTAVSVSGSVNTTALGTVLGSKTLFAFTDVNSDTKITDGTPTFNYTTGVTSTIHN